MQRRQFFKLMAASGAGAALASGGVPMLAGAADRPGASESAPVPTAPLQVMGKRSCDVVIVGAGLSGLTAARARRGARRRVSRRGAGPRRGEDADGSS